MSGTRGRPASPPATTRSRACARSAGRRGAGDVQGVAPATPAVPTIQRRRPRTSTHATHALTDNAVSVLSRCRTPWLRCQPATSERDRQIADQLSALVEGDRKSPSERAENAEFRRAVRRHSRRRGAG